MSTTVGLSTASTSDIVDTVKEDIDDKDISDVAVGAAVPGVVTTGSASGVVVVIFVAGVVEIGIWCSCPSCRITILNDGRRPIVNNVSRLMTSADVSGRTTGVEVTIGTTNVRCSFSDNRYRKLDELVTEVMTDDTNLWNLVE